MNKTFSLLILLLFYVTSFCQPDYGIKRVIKEYLGSDSLNVKVLDYDSEKPIYNATIKFCNNKNLIYHTDSTGCNFLTKYNNDIMEVTAEGNTLYEGYYPVYVSLYNEKIDNIIVLLERYYLTMFINKTDKTKGDFWKILYIGMLEDSARNKAEEDYEKDKIQLYSNSPLSKALIKISKQYNIKFIEDYKTPIEYRVKYNKRMLYHLDKKYGEGFVKKLENNCWYNSY